MRFYKIKTHTTVQRRGAIFAAAVLCGLLCFFAAAALQRGGGLNAHADTGATGIPDTFWYSADTNAADFVISTADELAGLSQIVNGEGIAAFSFSGKTVTMAADIDVSVYGSGTGWVPIGISGNFSGTFDGAGYSITNLRMDNTGITEGGLFGNVNGVIKNVSVTGSINAGDETGGIAGFLYQNGIIQNSSFIGTVQGTAFTGGIAGLVGASSTASQNPSIIDCYVFGSVSSLGDYPEAGGIAGRISRGMLLRNYAVNEVIAAQGNAGGIVGRADSAATIKECVALNSEITGNISGRITAADAANTTLENNYALDSIAGTFTDNPDGLDGGGISAFDILTDGTVGGIFSADNGFTVLDGFLPGLFGTAQPMPAHIRADLTGAQVVVPSAEYTGAEIFPESITAHLNGKTLTLMRGSDFEIDAIQDNINVGTASLTVRFIARFAGTADAEFLIRKTPSADDLTFSFPAASFNGSPQGIGAVSGADGLGAVTVYYEGTQGTLYPKTADLPVNAGTYAVTVDVSDGGGFFSGAQDIFLGVFTLAQLSGAGSVTIANWTYLTAAQAPNISGHDGAAAIAYSVYGADNFTADVPVTAGDYTVRVQFSATQNLAAHTAYANFTIFKTAGAAAPNAVSSQDVQVSAFSITVSPVEVQEGQIVEYAVSKTSAVPETGWQTDVTFVNLDADTTYYVFARIKGDENTQAGEASVTQIKTQPHQGTDWWIYVIITFASVMLAGGAVFGIWFVKRKPAPASVAAADAAAPVYPYAFPQDLTERELEVAKLIMQGKSLAVMAGELFISVSTLKTHISRILEKANCTNQKEFITKYRL